MPKIRRWFLGFILAVLWLPACMLRAEEPSPDAAPSANVAPAVSGEATPGEDSALPMSPQEVRDPFSMVQEAPVVVAAPVEAAPDVSVDLQGIGFGSVEAYAVIAGEVYYQGDEKNGIKLLEVRRREVDILMNGAKATVPLFSEKDLQKAKDRAVSKRAAEKVSAGQPSETSSSSSGREQLSL